LAACFEYRLDLEAPTGTPNYNPDITDGLWAFRMVFGAERDERFDWTRLNVLSLPNKKEC